MAAVPKFQQITAAGEFSSVRALEFSSSSLVVLYIPIFPKK